ncbi:MAG: hypothetical protein GF332_02900 [Candidatus Moranbacteria bacterium]|nr:hypothetical protein [Candidatus Moranbacteria bacterium]
MAIAVEKYARALCEATERASNEQLPSILAKFVALLKKHHRQFDLDLIVNQIQEIYQSDKKYSVPVLLEYLEINPTEQIKDFLKQQYPDKEIVIKAKQNPALIAGARLSTDEYLIDGSVQGKLASFKQRVG